MLIEALRHNAEANGRMVVAGLAALREQAERNGRMVAGGLAAGPSCVRTAYGVQLCRCDICGTYFRCQSGTERDCGNHR
jgi:hypothetical protein